MALTAMIMVAVLVAILIISFIFEQEQEQEQDSEAHHQTQGLDFNDNNMGQYSNYPSATQFEYSEKDNFLRDYIFESGNSNYRGQNYNSHPHPNYNHKMKQNQLTFSSNNNHASNGGSTCRYCCNCHRYQVITEEEFINLGDGRLLCRNCYSRSMKDAEDCKFLFHLVRKFFGLFDLELDEHPILLMDEYEIMRLRGDNLRCNGAFAHKSSLVGKTTTRIQSWSLDGGKIKKISVPQKKTNKEAWVLLTFGYPKVRTGATLAHEMMHSWFNRQGLKGIRKLEKNVEEGICEVMYVKWIDWYIANKYDSDDQFIQKLIPFYKANRAQMDGYKEAWDVVQKHGLKPTLTRLVKTRKYPES